MKYNIKVIPNAKRNSVVEENDLIKVYVNVPASEGKANKKLIELLADYFSVNKSNINIVKGEKSRDKVIDVWKN